MKASEHGLGFLYPPKEEIDEDAECHIWVKELWEYLVRGEMLLPRRKPSWWNQPAMRRLRRTATGLLEAEEFDRLARVREPATESE